MSKKTKIIGVVLASVLAMALFVLGGWYGWSLLEEELGLYQITATNLSAQEVKDLGGC